MRFFHITIENDELDINQMKKKLGEKYGRFFVKGTPVYDKYTNKKQNKKQNTNRWVLTSETKSNNINISLKTFLEGLLSKKELLPFLERFGSVVELVIYNENEKSHRQTTISRDNLELLVKLRATLKVISVDF